MTQTIKSDAVTLLALGSQMGLQGFEATRLEFASEPETPPSLTQKPLAAANRDHTDSSTILALAKSARLQCVADKGAL